MTYLALYLTSIIVLNCSSKDGDDSGQVELGIWISLDTSDTLDFRTSNNFYRSNGNMQNDSYDYKLLPMDTIRIGYAGKQFVLVEPTNHKYSLDNNELTIDFTNESCYGFEQEVITYRKE